MICPRIDSLAVSAGTLTVTGHIFQHLLLNIDEIMVYLGEDRMLHDDDAVFTPGEFRVTGPTTLEVMIPVSLLSGTLVPVRILISRRRINTAILDYYTVEI